MEFLLILLAPGLAFIIPHFFFRFIVKEIRDRSAILQNDHFINSKKRALGFKIATFSLLCIPIMYIIVSSAINPPHNDGLLWCTIFFLISLGLALNGIQAFKMYNYLFFVESHKKAALILSTPFLPSILLCFIVIFVGAAFLALPILIPLLVMQIILYQKRNFLFSK